MTYWYGDLLAHLHKAQTSLWTNRWREVYDFTPHKTDPSGVPNWRICPELQWEFMTPMEAAQETVAKVQQIKDGVTGFAQISQVDLEQIEIEF